MSQPILLYVSKLFESDWPSLSLVTELTTNTWNIRDSTFRVSNIPCLNRAVQTLPKEKLRNGTIIVKLETLKNLDLIKKFCNGSLFSSNGVASTVQLLLTGYKIPLVTTNEKNLSNSLLVDNVNEFVTIQPITQVPLLESVTYANMIGGYMFLRFPRRSRDIFDQLLFDNQPLHAKDSNWDERALKIYTCDYGYSVKPTIFTSNAKPFVVPPLHLMANRYSCPVKDLLDDKNISEDTKSFRGEDLLVTNSTHPMACQQCKSTQVWLFAYKHCGCTRELTSCFRCALTEWKEQILDQYQEHQKKLEGSIFDMDLDGIENDWENLKPLIAPNLLPMVACKRCHVPWSLFSLLHVQGDRIWFNERAKTTQRMQEKGQV